MSISTSRFTQNPVDAIQVTTENIEQVAAWCLGEKVHDHGEHYITLEVSHPTGRRIAKAFPGDWIVSVRASFRVYNNRAFNSTFKELPDVDSIQQYIMATVLDSVQVTISKGLSEDEKTTQLCEIVEKSTSRILDLL